MKLLTVQSSPASCHFPLGSKYYPQQPQLCSSLNVRNRISNPRTTIKEIANGYNREA